MSISASPPIFSWISFFSLFAVAALLLTAFVASFSLLPRSTPTKTRFLFIWHAFDALVHFTLEGSYLYNCFFTSLPIPLPHRETALFTDVMTPPGIHFLGEKNRLYGAFYGTGVTAQLWQEYARADRRWGGADLTLVSMELATVGCMAPLACLVCWSLVRGRVRAAWWWATVVAIGELYGGFMTFAPEWLTGSPSLDTSNFMYLWVYLFFFNTLWVWIPLFILWEAYGVFVGKEGRTDMVEKKKIR